MCYESTELACTPNIGRKGGAGYRQKEPDRKGLDAKNDPTRTYYCPRISVGRSVALCGCNRVRDGAEEVIYRCTRVRRWGGPTIVLFGLGGSERGTTAGGALFLGDRGSFRSPRLPNLPAARFPLRFPFRFRACVCKTRARTLPAGRLPSFTVHLVTDVGLLILLQWPFFRHC